MSKDKDSRNLATRRRQEARAEVIKKLQAMGLVQQVLADAEKLADEALSMDAVMVSRIGKANDLRLKLINKWLPDCKAVELTGEDGEDIRLDVIHRVIVDPKG